MAGMQNYNLYIHVVPGSSDKWRFCLCMWIPYFVDEAKTKDHYCPNCQAFLGSGKEWPYI